MATTTAAMTSTTVPAEAPFHSPAHTAFTNTRQTAQQAETNIIQTSPHNLHFSAINGGHQTLQKGQLQAMVSTVHTTANQYRVISEQSAPTAQSDTAMATTETPPPTLQATSPNVPENRSPSPNSQPHSANSQQQQDQEGSIISVAHTSYAQVQVVNNASCESKETVQTQVLNDSAHHAAKYCTPEYIGSLGALCDTKTSDNDKTYYNGVISGLISSLAELTDSVTLNNYIDYIALTTNLSAKKNKQSPVDAETVKNMLKASVANKKPAVRYCTDTNIVALLTVCNRVIPEADFNSYAEKSFCTSRFGKKHYDTLVSLAAELSKIPQNDAYIEYIATTVKETTNSDFHFMINSVEVVKKMIHAFINKPNTGCCIIM